MSVTIVEWRWSDIINAPRRLIVDIYNSLNTDKGGLSARKLSAITILALTVKITHEHTTDTNLENVLWLLLGFVLLCLGLVTIDKLIQLKANTGTKKEETVVTAGNVTATSTTIETQPKKEDIA